MFGYLFLGLVNTHFYALKANSFTIFLVITRFMINDSFNRPILKEKSSQLAIVIISGGFVRRFGFERESNEQRRRLKFLIDHCVL